MLVKKKFIEKISDLSNIEFKNISKKIILPSCRMNF